MSFLQFMKKYASNKQDKELRKFLLEELDGLTEALCSFLDKIPYPAIVFESENMVELLRDYWLQPSPTTSSKQISNDLKTVNSFLELLERYGENNDITNSFQRADIQGVKENIPTYNFVKCLQIDLNTLSKNKKKDITQSSLHALRKKAYYENAITKAEIEDFIKKLGKKYSFSTQLSHLRPYLKEIEKPLYT